MQKTNFLIEKLTKEVLASIISDYGVDWIEAMRLFYHSNTYDKLCKQETGLYNSNSKQIYELFNHEWSYGNI